MSGVFAAYEETSESLKISTRRCSDICLSFSKGRKVRGSSCFEPHVSFVFRNVPSYNMHSVASRIAKRASVSFSSESLLDTSRLDELPPLHKKEGHDNSSRKRKEKKTGEKSGLTVSSCSRFQKQLLFALRREGVCLERETADDPRRLNRGLQNESM